MRLSAKKLNILLFLLLAGVTLVVPQQLLAQGSGFGSGGTGFGVQAREAAGLPTPTPPSNTGGGVGGGVGINTGGSGAGTEAPAENPFSSACTWYSPTGCFLYFFSSTVTAIVSVFGTITYVAGLALDLAVKFAIMDLKDYIGQGAPLESIWKIVRDFCNMFFIFILLYVGLTKLLGLSGGNNWEKKVFAVLLSALLINFSLPIARATVDLSNLVSVQFYKKVSQNYENAQSGTGSFAEAAWANPKKSIAWSVISSMHKARSSNFVGKSEKDLSLSLSMPKILIGGLFEILLMLALSFVLFFGAALVLARGIVLIFLVILSPAPALLYHFDKTKGYYQKYIKTFFDQCIFLPAFIFTLYISLRVAIAVADKVGDAGLIAASVGYIIGLAAMGAPIIIATELGAAGGAMAANFAKTATGLGAGAMGGLLTRNLPGMNKVPGLASLNRISGGRIGAAMSYLPDTSTLNRAASAATLGATSGIMTTGAERSKAYDDYTARRASNTPEAREEEATKRAVANYRNQAAASGHNDNPAAHARFIAGMSKAEQKAYYKQLKPEDRKKLEGHLDPTVKANLGAERMDLLRGKPEEQLALLQGLKGEKLNEAYKKMNKNEKLALSRLIERKMREPGADVAGLTTMQNDLAVAGQSDDGRDPVKESQIRRNTAEQKLYMADLTDNTIIDYFESLPEGEQVTLYNSLDPDIKDKLPADVKEAMETKGGFQAAKRGSNTDRKAYVLNGDNSLENRAEIYASLSNSDRLEIEANPTIEDADKNAFRNKIGADATKKLEQAARLKPHLDSLANPTSDAAAIHSALKELEDEEIKQNERIIRTTPNIGAKITDINDLKALAKLGPRTKGPIRSAIENRNNSGEVGLAPLVSYMMSSNDWQ